MAKKTVFLTGPTGSMGGEAFLELLRRRDRFNIRLLLFPDKKGEKFFRKYKDEPGVKIIWGDITRYQDVYQGVCGGDYVLNTAALISPAADRQPELALKINYEGVLNIIQAIQAQNDRAQRIKFVNIASVAMTGDRRGIIRFGRVGDPLKPSIFDSYSISKIAAERALIESGLKYWVSLRMSFIAIPDIFSLLDPILFHQPLDTYGDLITKRDAGYMIVNACEENIPEEFWGRVYNASGGPAARFYYEEYLRDIFKLVGLGDYRKLMERKWFCLYNFHCQFFEDADILNNYLQHQRDSLQDHYRQILHELPLFLKVFRIFKLGKVIPPFIIKQLIFKPMAFANDGPMGWIRKNDLSRIHVFFGSLQEFEVIPNWEEAIHRSDLESERLNHGYDESKPENQLDISDMKSAAQFRGGECLSTEMFTGDLQIKLLWRCEFGHVFEASPYLILKAGHWCPECAPPPWNYAEIAFRNPFFAQVWRFGNIYKRASFDTN